MQPQTHAPSFVLTMVAILLAFAAPLCAMGRSASAATPTVASEAHVGVAAELQVDDAGLGADHQIDAIQ